MASTGSSENVVDLRRPIKRDQGFAEEVLHILRRDILSLRIPPDTRISIDSLARELGVSQTPIREALRQLEVMGLVTKRHYAGYHSAPKLTRRQFNELYEVRLQLEPHAARLAATRMDAAQLEQLRALASEMQPGLSHPSFGRFAEQDGELHDLIAEGSGNRIIQEMLAQLRLHFHDEVTTEAMTEHDKLLAALAAHDGPGAEAAMREHIERSYARLAPFASESEEED